MRQETIRQALSNIQERKRKNEADFQAKMRPLYDDKDYQSLNETYTKLLIENARKEAYGEPVDKTKENQTQQQIEAIKAKLHLSGVTLSYCCPICQDEGYKDGQMCKCLKREISKIILKDSGFEGLENFNNVSKIDPTLMPYCTKMQKWCHSDFNKNLIYIAGPTGVGKTFLTSCMANELIERGLVTKVTTAFKMNQSFKEFVQTHNDELLNTYLDCDVLFVDDLGTEPLYKNTTIECLYLIINERKMRKLPTVITSNFTLEDIRNTYDERIYSRIVDRKTSITLYLDGADKRTSL